MIRIHLKFSKCDQLGQGVHVFLGHTDNELCLVVALLNYITQRGDHVGPFFCSHAHSPLTKQQLVAKVREALTTTGVNCTGYSGHSFRIGAATATARARIPDSTIQALGRWSSAAFLRYIRTPHDQLAGVSRTLSRVS